MRCSRCILWCCVPPRALIPQETQVKLKCLLPAADVGLMLSRRPSLLLASELDGAIEAVMKLRLTMYKGDEAGLVSAVVKQPGLLVADVDECFMSATFGMLP